MTAILLKNFYFYKRNVTELILQFLGSMIEVAPIYFMLSVSHINELEIHEVLMNYILAVCILNIIVNVSFIEKSSKRKQWI